VRCPAPDSIFNRAEALDRVEGDEQILREIVRLFLGGLPEMLADIDGAVRRRDAPAVERAAHSLKGSVGSLGARRAFDAALGLEALGRDGVMADPEPARSELLRETEALVQALDAFLAEQPA
jgi:HPt (histidine-containing phosphotransfer) domain-containing protein